MGELSLVLKRRLSEITPHCMEGKEEELGEKVTFRQKHLTGWVKADRIPSSVSALGAQELSEVIFNCPKFLIRPISSSRALTVLEGCCVRYLHEELGNSLVSPTSVQQTSRFPVHRSYFKLAERGLGLGWQNARPSQTLRSALTCQEEHKRWVNPCGCFSKWWLIFTLTV